MSDCVRGCRTPRRHVDACPGDCAGCQPRQATHGHLCQSCHRRLELLVVDMPGVAEWLEVHLPAGSKPAGDTKLHRRKGEPPLPVDLDILDHQATIAAVLRGWVDVLVEGTSLTGPVDRSIRGCARYLHAHLTAVEVADWLIDLYDELAQLTSLAHSLAPWRPQVRRCHGIPCPECQAMALVVYGGDEDVTCQECRVLIPASRYSIWTRMLADVQQEPA